MQRVKIEKGDWKIENWPERKKIQAPFRIYNDDELKQYYSRNFAVVLGLIITAGTVVLKISVLQIKNYFWVSSTHLKWYGVLLTIPVLASGIASLVSGFVPMRRTVASVVVLNSLALLGSLAEVIYSLSASGFKSDLAFSFKTFINRKLITEHNDDNDEFADFSERGDRPHWPHPKWIVFYALANGLPLAVMFSNVSMLFAGITSSVFVFSKGQGHDLDIDFKEEEVDEEEEETDDFNNSIIDFDDDNDDNDEGDDDLEVMTDLKVETISETRDKVLDSSEDDKKTLNDDRKKIRFDHQDDSTKIKETSTAATTTTTTFTKEKKKMTKRKKTTLRVLGVGCIVSAAIYLPIYYTVVSEVNYYVSFRDPTIAKYVPIIMGFYFGGLLALGHIRLPKKKTMLALGGSVLFVSSVALLTTSSGYYSRNRAMERQLNDNCINADNKFCIYECFRKTLLTPSSKKQKKSIRRCLVFCMPKERLCDGIVDTFSVTKYDAYLGNFGCVFSRYAERYESWNKAKFDYYWPGADELHCHERWIWWHIGAYFVGFYGILSSVILLAWSKGAMTSTTSY